MSSTNPNKIKQNLFVCTKKTDHLKVDSQTLIALVGRPVYLSGRTIVVKNISQRKIIVQNRHINKIEKRFLKNNRFL